MDKIMNICLKEHTRQLHGKSTLILPSCALGDSDKGSVSSKLGKGVFKIEI
jgi:hypothetical protein